MRDLVSRVRRAFAIGGWVAWGGVLGGLVSQGGSDEPIWAVAIFPATYLLAVCVWAAVIVLLNREEHHDG